MRIDVLTLFPPMVEGPLSLSLLGRARERALIDVRVHDLREWAEGRHRVADDTPYGGGAGMVMKVDVAARALDDLKAQGEPPRVILMGPSGRVFRQEIAHELASLPRMILVCGHYEGIDDRIRREIDEELSIGDYILTGGELAALVVIDAVARLVPGVVGNADSLPEESFETGLLDHPHFTRPRVFKDEEVPAVLLSGNHGAIRRWRREQALRRTWLNRPELLRTAPLTVEDRRFLAALRGGQAADEAQTGRVGSSCVPSSEEKTS